MSQITSQSQDSIFKLIIVDDEDIIREGISQQISWVENGFELAGVFEDGSKALAFIKEHKVDVVISDIYMPHMDGLALSRELAEHYPEIMVLLLTGYDDFEYAHKAVKNQVREFLLKPITAAELEGVLRKVWNELFAAEQKEREQKLMQEKLEQSYPLLRERFLNRLVTGRILKSDAVYSQGTYLEWNNLNGFYQVLVIHIPASWEELESISLSEHLKSITSEWDEVFFNRHEDLIVLLQENQEESLIDRYRTLAEDAFFFASSFDKDQIAIGCGEIVYSFDKLHLSYQGAQKAVEYSKVMGLTQILSIYDLRRRNQVSLEEFNRLTKKLIEILPKGKREETTHALEEIFTYLEQYFISADELPMYLTRLHYLLFYFVQDMGLYSSGEIFFPYNQKTFSSFTAARGFFITMINSLEDRIHSKRNDLLLSRIQKARKIIDEEYQNPHFSLRDICNKLYLSSSQFSVIFKEGTGQTFIEFLTNYRIDRAKQLLKTSDLKSYQIAEQVGFSDARYFSLTFKKLTGLTPKEYRNSLEQ